MLKKLQSKKKFFFYSIYETDVEDIEEHLRGHRLRLLRHLERMNVESLKSLRKDNRG